MMSVQTIHSTRARTHTRRKEATCLSTFFRRLYRSAFRKPECLARFIACIYHAATNVSLQDTLAREVRALSLNVLPLSFGMCTFSRGQNGKSFSSIVGRDSLSSFNLDIGARPQQHCLAMIRTSVGMTMDLNVIRKQL